MELLERLAQQKNCAYISDLRFLPKSDRHFPQLKEVDITAYSDWEWKDAAWYILHRRCRNGEQARKLLIG
ncbi:hypothetical protein [Pseudoflavonifractor phocaeensis]|uniref:hypothetical protein n=1 Tax=Pseudoflavonifractor phocaeensis TaxID=1870988 RepID=UPI001957CC69|nr:hypothetical protein [Pseudoflavonifractor phocaeensis]MBM6884325.1 hypothetical protein [Pseudoflavonifractor phocaeensis]